MALERDRRAAEGKDPWRMTEGEARALLRAKERSDRLEIWLAEQPWRPIRGGWEVSTTLLGWLFRIEPVQSGLRLKSYPSEGAAPAVWYIGS
jgi:hypothetical protein